MWSSTCGGGGILLKGTNIFSSDFSGLTCLLQLHIRLHLSDNRKFWNTEGVDAFTNTDDAFLTKSWTFHLVRIIRFCSNFASLWHKHLIRNYKWNFRLPMSAFATVTRNTLLDQQLFTQIFVFKLFHISIGVANSTSSKHYL